MDQQRATEFVREYLSALENFDAEGAMSLFAPHAVQEEMPNRLFERGQRRDVAALSASAKRSRDVLASHRYRIERIVVNGEDVAAELDWHGELKVAFGALAKGHVLHARIAMFLTLRDGRIVSQRNYDCYDPF